ncbi:YbhB/YbcL family Raf kinase inhibitor-like protein [Cryobacterium sp. PH31-O1]|uniref:YbhB/YbcL family Raf kinase inhibitor-like protein n=1 Tax=Cryobacterium sp. PH31-O1 TaxID=3046306 RepID=UPI0024B999B9|nr:YbhB/YbcL family Raf kinase inhibitor-like protein [Cryobacterium sp. PH31-O1]MDJ0339830.1 YbhB/YbcL family Raf kinase inhibitor-like protein [Cryobacterium sp. PH31-O1]
MTIDPLARFGAVPQFSLTSTVMTDGGPLLAAQYGADAGGADVSPQLSWSGFPADTQSFALTVFDPDAPTGSGFWHWAVADIPVSVTELAAGAGNPGGALPAGSLTLPNEYRLTSFVGAGPPPGTGTHRYQFIVHAVDVATLDLDPQSTPGVLGFNLHFHTLARAVLEATGVAGGASAA